MAAPLISDEQMSRMMSDENATPVISDEQMSRMMSDENATPVPASGLVSKYFPASAVPTMLKIMRAESSAHPDASNTNKNGTQDHGLFQINDVNIPSLQKAGIITSKHDLYDPDKNVRAAAFLYKQSGTQPWNSSRGVWGVAGAKSANDVMSGPSKPNPMSQLGENSSPDLGTDPKSIWSQSHPEEADMMARTSPTEKFLVGVGSGMKDIWQGVSQTGLKVGETMGLTSPETLQNYTQNAEQERETVEPLMRTSLLAKAGSFVGGTVPYMAIPGMGEGSLAARVGVSALTGGAMGATQFIPPSEDDSWTSRGKKSIGGAAVGAATEGVVTGLLKAGAKGLNAAKGNINETEFSRLGQQYDVPMTAAEAMKGRSSRLDTMKEYLPGWMGGIKNFRRGQEQKAESAAMDLFSQYAINPSAPTTAAMKLENNAYIKGLYDKVRGIASSVPKSSLTNTKQIVKQLSARYPEIFESLQDKRAKTILEDIAGDLRDKTVYTGLVNAQGQPIMNRIPASISFGDLWEARKGLSDAWRKARVAHDETASRELGILYKAFDRDMEESLTKVGGTAVNDFKAANKAWQQYSLKFDVMREAFDKAEGTTSAHEMFSPKTFSTALKKLASDDRYKPYVRWNPQEVKQMTGLANVLQVVQRSARFMEDPTNGSRVTPLVLLGAGAEASKMIGGMVGTGGSATAIGTGSLAIAGQISRWFTTTPTGKRLLMSASEVAPNSPAMRRIIFQATSAVTKGATAEYYRKVNGETPLLGSKNPRWKNIGEGE